jgi:hypothetical protein
VREPTKKLTHESLRRRWEEREKMMREKIMAFLLIEIVLGIQHEEYRVEKAIYFYWS